MPSLRQKFYYKVLAAPHAFLKAVIEGFKEDNGWEDAKDIQLRHKILIDSLTERILSAERVEFFKAGMNDPHKDYKHMTTWNEFALVLKTSLANYEERQKLREKPFKTPPFKSLEDFLESKFEEQQAKIADAVRPFLNWYESRNAEIDHLRDISFTSWKIRMLTNNIILADESWIVKPPKLDNQKEDYQFTK